MRRKQRKSADGRKGGKNENEISDKEKKKDMPRILRQEGGKKKIADLNNKDSKREEKGRSARDLSISRKGEESGSIFRGGGREKKKFWRCFHVKKKEAGKGKGKQNKERAFLTKTWKNRAARKKREIGVGSTSGGSRLRKKKKKQSGNANKSAKKSEQRFSKVKRLEEPSLSGMKGGQRETGANCGEKKRERSYGYFVWEKRGVPIPIDKERTHVLGPFGKGGNPPKPIKGGVLLST